MPVVVVGAGVTGLSVGIELLRQGRQVIILEKESVPGGLCRSYQYGPFTFDIGPHRLFTANASLTQFFLSILGQDYLEVPRVSQVKLNGRFHTWPLTYKSVLSLPPKFVWGCARDLLRRKTSAPGPVATLQDYVTAQYGPTIYDVFWRDYTEKFLGLQCHQVDAEWGELSVGRSLVDRNAPPTCVRDMVKDIVVQRRSTLRFLYPAGGMGTFAEHAVAQIRQMGGQVILNAPVQSIARTDGGIGTVSTGTGEYRADQLVWTGRLTDLCGLLGEAVPPTLTYLPTVLLNIEIEGEMRGEWQWTYFPSRDIIFSRISRPCKFDIRTAPRGMTGLCVEVTDPRGRWAGPDFAELTERVVSDLVRTGLIASSGQVRQCHIERAENAYPIYVRGFQPEVARTCATLRRYPNLHLAGRQALFVHDNIDEAVIGARDLAARLIATP